MSSMADRMMTRLSTRAAMHQLPPSPELMSGNLVHQSTIPGFSLDVKPSILRYIASYETFKPRAIACSGLIQISDDYSHSDRGFCSLGAVAGDNGIALFQTSKPDVPILILNHSLAGNQQSDAIGSLCFEPNTTNTLRLAASRGNGVFVWDVSGHSMSPLLGRLSLNFSTTDPFEGTITAVAWKPAPSQSMLAMTTSASASIWDLRTSLGTKMSRPSLRIGSNSSNFRSSPLVQLACSKTDKCATIDQSGTMRVYDLRMLHNTKFGKGDDGGKPRMLSVIPAFSYAGVGISSFPLSNDEDCWVSWGLDSGKADAIVKVFSLSAWTNEDQKEEIQHAEAESYWYMDGSTDRTSQAPSKLEHGKFSPHQQIAQFTTPHLACAQVCPRPFEDSIVTVGFTRGTGADNTTPGWKAELWKMQLDGDDEVSETTNTFGVDKVLSCEGYGLKNSKLGSSIGKSVVLGSLQSVSLALAVHEPPFGRSSRSEKKPQELELMLCGLSDKGFVTTNAITTAPWTKKDRARVTATRMRPANSMRYFSKERKMFPAVDAASTLNNTGEVIGQTGSDEVLSKIVDESSSPASPVKNSESNQVQFEMDLTVKSQSHEQGNIRSSSIFGSSSNSNDQPPQGSRPAGRIRAERIPCPRFCGASFSTIGLVRFENGEIAKMWSSFQTQDPKRQSTSPRLLIPAQELDQENSHITLYPRTKKDLDDMNKARETKWEETNESSSDAESEDPMEDFYQLKLDDEVTFEDSAYLDDANDEVDDKNDSLYEQYFGGNRSNPFENTKNDSEQQEKVSQSADVVRHIVVDSRDEPSPSFEAPSSDLLAPVVSIDIANNEFALGGQTVYLAENLLLGDWRADLIQDAFDDDTTQATASSLDTLGAFPSTNPLEHESKAKSSRRTATLKAILPSLSSPKLEPQYYSKGGISPLKNPLSKVKSDPIVHKPLGLQLSSKAIPPSYVGDDASVHGGHFRVRPGRGESVLFLSKLQKQHGFGEGYQESPPDAPIHPGRGSKSFGRVSSPRRIAQTPRELKETKVGAPADNQAAKVGVFTLKAPSTGSSQLSGLSNMRMVCIRNSDVCHEANQHEKASTWSVVAQAIENMIEAVPDGFNGSDFGLSSALGRDLISNIMRFYEREGDIQMMATLICVLSGGGRRVTRKEFRMNISLLPPNQEDKFDLFLQRYGQVLYRWGLITKRTEVLKHLATHCQPNKGSEVTSPVNGSICSVVFSITCPRCRSTTVPGTNICKSCQDYAFRCMLCDNAVRGAFVVCHLCGHGGHIGCMNDWFTDQSTCASGCGCRCRLKNPTPLQFDKANSVVGDKPEDRPPM